MKIIPQRGVAKRYLSAEISQFPKSYRKLIDHDSGLFIFGERGVGKTHLMVALMKNDILNTPARQRWAGNYQEPELDDYPLIIAIPELLYLIRGEINSNGPEAKLDEYSNRPRSALSRWSPNRTNRRTNLDC